MIFFFEREEWIPVPPDFSLNIVQGKSYDLAKGHGLSLWEAVQKRLGKQSLSSFERNTKVSEPEARYGHPTMVVPRLGQGAFRILVTDAYHRQCAVTQEKTLPALEAAHIKPFNENGPHRIENGILLRSDIHRLFDTGYITISPDYNFEVSKRIREDFENGRDYYAMQGRSVNLPEPLILRPSQEFLKWHNEKIFRG